MKFLMAGEGGRFLFPCLLDQRQGKVGGGEHEGGAIEQLYSGETRGMDHRPADSLRMLHQGFQNRRVAKSRLA
jgi:hypothetical protein